MNAQDADAVTAHVPPAKMSDQAEGAETPGTGENTTANGAADALAPSIVTVVTEPGFTMSMADIGAMIEATYQRYLRRTASFTEIRGWLQRLRDGVTLTTVIASIADSAEAIEIGRQHAGVIREIEHFGARLGRLYRMALARTARPEEVRSWFDAHAAGMPFWAIMEEIATSDEAKAVARIVDTSDGEFVQLATELVLATGAPPCAIAQGQADIAASRTTRAAMLLALFRQRTAARLVPHLVPVNDPEIAWIEGSGRHVDIAEWRERRAAPASNSSAGPSIARFPFHLPVHGGPLVSIITSLYRGGRYIDTFLSNIAAQTIFDHCELIIVDAASDEDEGQRIAAFAADRTNIIYIRLPARVGIYVAWNIAIQQARGRYCTNANLDDSRRNDSLEIQAATLDALPFVDVVTQDTYYSFEANLPFEAIRHVGFQAEFVNADAYSLMTSNSPHSAPMWRRSLHNEVGGFDERYRSASDYDFWLRCAAAGKTFYRIADAHAAYFYNPDGLSTCVGSIAGAEIDAIRVNRTRDLIAPALLEDEAAFATRLGRWQTTVDAADDAAADDAAAVDSRYVQVQRALLSLATRAEAEVLAG